MTDEKAIEVVWISDAYLALIRLLMTGYSISPNANKNTSTKPIILKICLRFIITS